MSEQPDTPTVYEAVNRVMREITNLRKDGVNTHFGFKFRGIDALLNAIAVPVRNHGVIIAPRLKSVDSEVFGKSIKTVVEMEYDVYGPRGDSFTVCYPGEAADQGDKSVGKACSYAFKMLCFVLFAIPIDAETADDPDSVSPQIDYSGPRQRTNQTRGARRDTPAGRPAPAIYAEALKATDPQEVTKLASEARQAGVIGHIANPDDREPVQLGNALWNLKTQLEQRAAKQDGDVA